jgi:heme/copper-type cytochrome/quinol oxidase subunit 2
LAVVKRVVCFVGKVRRRKKDDDDDESEEERNQNIEGLMPDIYALRWNAMAMYLVTK